MAAGSEGGMRLSGLVARTGVPASTIHHYRRLGLLPAPLPGPAGSYTYSEDHVDAVQLIRALRAERGLSFAEIADVLPSALRAASDDRPTVVAEALPADGRQRAIEAGLRQFAARSYAEVTVAEVAADAGMAKGSVYRYFASKEDLFLAVVELLLADTASEFAAAVRRAGGPAGIAGDRDAAASAFARVVAGALPILLELGARAAKGDRQSQGLARRVLATLAEAAGRPLTAGAPADTPAGQGGLEAPDEEAVAAGLDLITQAFAVVLRWSIAGHWPQVMPSDQPGRRRSRGPARTLRSNNVGPEPAQGSVG